MSRREFDPRHDLAINFDTIGSASVIFGPFLRGCNSTNPTPLIRFVGCQCQVKALVKALALIIAQQASENGDFYLQKCQILDVLWQIWVASVVGKQLYDLDIHS